MVVWNLDLLHSLKETDSLLVQLQKEVAAFVLCREELTDLLSVSRFMEFVHMQESIACLCSRLSVRAGLWFSENTSDSKCSAYRAMISEVCTRAQNDLLFFSLWFKGLSDAAAQKYISHSGKYRYHLEEIRKFKPFTLSEKEERLASLKDLSGVSALENIYDILTNKFAYPWNGKQITVEELNHYSQSFVRQERVDSYEKKFAKYAEEQAVLGEIYRNIVLDWRNENVLVRGMTSPLFVRNLSNDIPDAAVDVLLAVVQKNVKVFQEYFQLKAQICGLTSFDRYDLYAPYLSEEKVYSYEQSKKIVLSTYKLFSPSAALMAKKIFDMQMVHSDVVPNKRSGAFCWASLPSLPPYVMLNHIGKLKDVFTMMHEFGHGIHAVAASDQTVFTFHSALPLAETASTFGEMLLSQRLLTESSSVDEKISILLRNLDGHYASIVRQAYFVLFEKGAHEKIAAGSTVEDLNAYYLSLLREQFGSVSVPDSFQYEWSYIPHIYHTPFYCYAYVFGELLVLSLYKMYEEQGNTFVSKYMKLLSLGGSKSPADILSEIGVDICQESFWQCGFDVISEEVARLRELVAQR